MLSLCAGDQPPRRVGIRSGGEELAAGIKGLFPSLRVLHVYHLGRLGGTPLLGALASDPPPFLEEIFYIHDDYEACLNDYNHPADALRLLSTLTGLKRLCFDVGASQGALQAFDLSCLTNLTNLADLLVTVPHDCQVYGVEDVRDKCLELKPHCLRVHHTDFGFLEVEDEDEEWGFDEELNPDDVYTDEDDRLWC